MNALLPDKYLPLQDSYLGLGAIVLKMLQKEPMDVVKLWNRCERIKSIGTYDRFIVTLGILFRAGLIGYDNHNLIRRSS